jgi:hypothetical protein
MELDEMLAKKKSRIQIPACRVVAGWPAARQGVPRKQYWPGSMKGENLGSPMDNGVFLTFSLFDGVLIRP